MGRHTLSFTWSKALAALLVLGTASGAYAQQSDSEPLIAPPETVKNPGYHGSLGDVASQAGKHLGEDVETLRKNLGILHDLNSQANQDAINQLGRNYANIPGVGSNLGASINSVDLELLRDSSDKMVTNIQGTMDKYGKASTDLTSRLSAAIKDSPYNAKNPPDKAGAAGLGQQAKQMAKDEVDKVLPVLGIDFTGVMKLDNNISKLNANVVSITKTYVNLIHTAEQPPSTLTENSDLPTELATINNLAGEQMSVLPTLGKSMAVINNNYTNLKENKLKSTKDEVGAINANLSMFNENLQRGNNEMHLSLGNPVPPTQSTAATAPADGSQ